MLKQFLGQKGQVVENKTIWNILGAASHIQEKEAAEYNEYFQVVEVKSCKFILECPFELMQFPSAIMTEITFGLL